MLTLFDLETKMLTFRMKTETIFTSNTKNGQLFQRKKKVEKLLQCPREWLWQRWISMTSLPSQTAVASLNEEIDKRRRRRQRRRRLFELPLAYKHTNTCISISFNKRTHCHIIINCIGIQSFFSVQRVIKSDFCMTSSAD